MSQAGPSEAGQRMRTIIVDDEPPARQWLSDLLREEETVEVVEECADGFGAIEAIERLQPELVLLDVEMPGLGGFEVVEMLGANAPAIVFVTAFDQYAVRAFDVHAADYLLKPVDPDRLREAVRRSLLRVRRGPRPAEEARSAALALSGRKFPEWLLVKADGRSRFLRVREIDWIESQKNDVIIHAGTAEYVYHLSTSGIEARLDPAKFLRIHRSTIVHVERIKDLYPLFNGDYGVTLKDGTSLTMSSTYRRRLPAFRDGML